MNDTSRTIVEMRNIHKWYGRVHAVDGANLTINEGESVGLLGDNGAGKSTLIKILSGYHHPDEGEIFIEGKKTKIDSPADARDLGIETVYQEQALVDMMSVARNFHMGREPVKWGGFLNKAKMDECMIPLRTLGLSIKSPDLLVKSLSGGEKQGTAIARALYFKAKLVILDEPTRALSVREVQTVQDFVKGLKEANIAVIYISHTIHHVHSIVDRFVILKRGKVAENFKKGEVTLDQLINVLMD